MEKATIHNGLVGLVETMEKFNPNVKNTKNQHWKMIFFATLIVKKFIFHNLNIETMVGIQFIYIFCNVFWKLLFLKSPFKIRIKIMIKFFEDLIICSVLFDSFGKLSLEYSNLLTVIKTGFVANTIRNLLVIIKRKSLWTLLYSKWKLVINKWKRKIVRKLQ